MKIGVLSGKGGTGKTFISTNLTNILDSSYYLDCDVEEPNGHLYFKPEITSKKYVSVMVPKVDKDLCDGCQVCVEFCKFNSLAYVNEELVIFNETCHSCKGCVLFCPQKALEESNHPIGKIISGKYKNNLILTGKLNIGEVSGTAIIDSLLEEVSKDDDNRDVIIDCPPGSSCSVMDSIRDVDYCVLVVEPTIFSLENFKMVHELVKLFNKPHGVVINKSYGDNSLVEDFCNENDIEILLTIPFDRELGEINSNGILISEVDKEYREIFIDLSNDIRRRLE